MWSTSFELKELTASEEARIAALVKDSDEIIGSAFNSAGNRLYFSSQRGGNGNGITYEVTGPFR